MSFENLSSLIEIGIGFLVFLIGKGGIDWYNLRRRGKLMEEKNLVTSLTTALTAAEKREASKDATHAREVAGLEKSLALRIRQRDYWQGDAANARFVLREKTGIELPAATPPEA